MHTTQTDLLRAVRDSANREAWGSFYRIYSPMLRNFGLRRSLPESEADDLSQDVLMVAQRALREGRYDPRKGRFRAWLYGVARKRASFIHRSRRRRTRVQASADDGGIDLLGNLEDPHEDTQKQIWEQEWRYALLDEALHQLGPDLGTTAVEAFELYGVQGLPVEEVAARLNVAVASVYAYKSRVLAAIRQWVAQYEDDK